MFLDCPEYMDEHGSVRCGLPAEVLYRYELASTDGPLESAKIGCPRGHWFNGPIEFLSWDKAPNTMIRPADKPETSEDRGRTRGAHRTSLQPRSANATASWHRPCRPE
jgi:hypothetical protein